MFNAATIQAGFTGLVGFKQTYAKGIDRLDSDISASSAGVLIDSVSGHPLITMENILVCAEIFQKENVVVWANGTGYKIDDIVSKGTDIYFAIKDGTGKDPATETTYWTKTNVLSAFLRRMLQAAANNVFNAVFAKRKLYEVGKTLLTDISLYEGTGSLTTKITKLGRFVGHRIKPKYADTVLTISSIGLQLDTANPALKLYVYQSSSKEPLHEIGIAHNKVVTFDWHKLSEGIELAFGPESLNDDCFYYIGYYEDDLVGQAIWRQETNFDAGCASCNGINAVLYRQWSNFFTIQPIYITSTYINADRTMFEEDKQISLSNQNWGMNFKIQVRCDVSNLIVRNKLAFTDAIRLQVVHDLLNSMAYSMRDNQQKSKISQMAFYALENKENFEKGVRAKLDQAIDGVSFDLTEINKVCLPCTKGATGVKIKSIYSR